MSKAKTIKFNGSEVTFSKPTTATGVAITAVEATSTPTVSATGLTAVMGDVITISGLPGFDGSYVVSSVSTGKFTLVGVDWSGKTVPSSFTNAKGVKVEFSPQFCGLKSFQKSGASIEQVDVSTICSVEGKDYESGDREEGSVTLGFWLEPNSDVQNILEGYEFSGEKFWTKLKLSNNKGSYLFYGNVETGLNLDGQVNGRWDSGLAVKISGRRYFVGTGV